VNELLAVPLEEGGVIIVESVAPAHEGGSVKAARPGELVGQVKRSLEEALEPVTAAARATLLKLREAGPDEVTVEFGVQFKTELGAVISKSTGECNFKVTLRWGGADADG